MQDAPMKIEARFDARLLDELKRENEALRTALREELDALTNWRACLKLPPDLESGFAISIDNIERALAERGQS